MVSATIQASTQIITQDRKLLTILATLKIVYCIFPHCQVAMNGKITENCM